MGPQKVRDIAVLRAELRRSWIAKGVARPRSRKRKFGNEEPEETAVNQENDDEIPADTRSVG